MATPTRPVLLTGASGALGRMLTRRLAAAGWTLRLSDIAAFPDPVPQGATFDAADLADQTAVDRIAEGCGLILHFGGVSTEHPFKTVLGPNICGLYNVYEAARKNKARVVFASSNHAIGFHERTEKLDADCQLRPDGYYGLSKAFGELVGRLYWDKHGVETVVVRIGSSFPEVKDERMLSTWLSFNDLASLMIACADAPAIGYAVIWGASDNQRSFWGADSRARIGWAPKDSADTAAENVRGKVTENCVIERYQGGSYAAMDYSREEPSPRSLFE
ncbi:MAG: NAD(P)-dependent oxidoreductase [Acetobacteraceae bacterium]|nr:NAD(P)-dependent oxidoreductase [Acetobacteraceae bacterium]